MPKRIYVADDEKNILDLITQVLTNEGFEVTPYTDGDKLFRDFQTKPADLVILDIMMPGTDGLVISTKIRSISTVPIIIVSARDSEMDRITGIALGSDDYLTKPFSPMELVVRVKAILRRVDINKTGTASENKAMEFGNIRLEPLSRDVWVGDTKIDLTPTEFELMGYMITNHPKAISRDELLKNVWKVSYDVDTRATDDVIKRLRKKLKSANADSEIESVWGYGFRLLKL